MERLNSIIKHLEQEWDRGLQKDSSSEAKEKLVEIIAEKHGVSFDTVASIMKRFEIKNYVQELFPECLIEVQQDFYIGDSLKMRIDNPDGRIRHLVSFSSEFMEDFTTDEIFHRLNIWNLKSNLHKAGKKEVLISSNGLIIQG
jgi:hypothetical protein